MNDQKKEREFIPLTIALFLLVVHGLLHTMSDANCFIILPEDGESVEPGTEVEVQPFFGLT